jgi:hypothetical protein
VSTASTAWNPPGGLLWLVIWIFLRKKTVELPREMGISASKMADFRSKQYGFGLWTTDLGDFLAMDHSQIGKS